MIHREANSTSVQPDTPPPFRPESFRGRRIRRLVAERPGGGMGLKREGAGGVCPGRGAEYRWGKRTFMNSSRSGF